MKGKQDTKFGRFRSGIPQFLEWKLQTFIVNTGDWTEKGGLKNKKLEEGAFISKRVNVLTNS